MRCSLARLNLRPDSVASDVFVLVLIVLATLIVFVDSRTILLYGMDITFECSLFFFLCCFIEEDFLAEFIASFNVVRVVLRGVVVFGTLLLSLLLGIFSSFRKLESNPWMLLESDDDAIG